MAFVLATAIGAGVAGAAGLVKVGVGISQKNKAKKRQDDAKTQMEADKEAYMNIPITNPYANMENTMEDLTVNTKAANFEAQKSEQARADIMQNMSAAAGGSGIAALAQSMANQANQEAQAASASIATQEAANQAAERKEAGNLQELERQGQVQADNLKRDRMATQLGMSQAELQAEGQNVADSQAAIMSGISDIGGAAGMFASGLAGKKKANSDLTPKQQFIQNNPDVDLEEQQRLIDKMLQDKKNQGN